jgi:hypothetical protein
MYNRCMRKQRTNIYLDEQDKQALAHIRERYHLDSDAAAVRFAIHRVATEEERADVLPSTRPHRQNETAR